MLKPSVLLPDLPSFNAKVESDYSGLKLCMNSAEFDMPISLLNNTRMIDSMIEADYLADHIHFHDEFTETIIRNHRDFINNVKNKDINFGDYQSDIKQLIKIASEKGLNTNNTVLKFQLANSKHNHSLLA